MFLNPSKLFLQYFLFVDIGICTVCNGHFIIFSVFLVSLSISATSAYFRKKAYMPSMSSYLLLFNVFTIFAITDSSGGFISGQWSITWSSFCEFLLSEYISFSQADSRISYSTLASVFLLYCFIYVYVKRKRDLVRNLWY